MDYRDKLPPRSVVHFSAAAPVRNPAAVDNLPIIGRLLYHRRVEAPRAMCISLVTR